MLELCFIAARHKALGKWVSLIPLQLVQPTWILLALQILNAPTVVQAQAAALQPVLILVATTQIAAQPSVHCFPHAAARLGTVVALTRRLDIACKVATHQPFN
jgi:hypothetical protein